jgi:beta-phosphoglucomutase-like phosphatase (HAD superfamily)
MIEGVVKRNGFGEYFDLVVGREDVRQHKPHPEAYVLALSRLNISAKDAVVFEDSEAGVVAGCAAGCRVVAIRHEYNRRHDFSEAMRVIESYDEFVFTEQT